MDKDRNYKYLEIAERAEKEGIYTGDRLSLLMDIESADKKFKQLLVEPVKKGGRKSNVIFI